MAKNFISWFYSKDFSLWQNLGHLSVVVFLFILFLGVVVK
jgi:hypothetical protein